ncbi:uncharacterized protein Dvar_48370 [Desulfosarcina variabilis str. Montpellier]
MVELFLACALTPDLHMGLVLVSLFVYIKEFQHCQELSVIIKGRVGPALPFFLVPKKNYLPSL